MDREKERERLPYVKDDASRQYLTTRIEVEYHIGLAVTNLLTSRKQAPPENEKLARIVGAIQVLMYDNGITPTPEQAARIKYANQVLDAEFR